MFDASMNVYNSNLGMINSAKKSRFNDINNEIFKTKKSSKNNSFSDILSVTIKREDNATKESSLIKQAKKDYSDEYLTGLTDEEREEIKKLAAKYIESHDISDESGMKSLADYVAGLLKQFGFKGDIEEMANMFALEISKQSNTNAET